jgi:hypothetical protein
MNVTGPSDPFPKVVMNKDGKTMTVHTLREQDAALAKGYSRLLARKAER